MVPSGGVAPRGRGRLGVWTETGIVETFPEDGLEYTWRTPLRARAPGVLVAGCRADRCRFCEGSRIADEQARLAREVLEQIGEDPDRIQADWSGLDKGATRTGPTTGPTIAWKTRWITSGRAVPVAANAGG